jgi:hypothetical protein
MQPVPITRGHEPIASEILYCSTDRCLSAASQAVRHRPFPPLPPHCHCRIILHSLACMRSACYPLQRSTN